MRLITNLVFLLLLSLAGRAQPPFCKLSGAFFEESDPARIQYRVYLEETEAFADLVVFKSENALFADKPGLWYFTRSRAEATWFIAFVKEREKADFSVFFTETESFAGCQTQR